MICPLCHYDHAEVPTNPLVMTCPWKVDRPGTEEECTITVTVPRRVLEDALKDPKMWQILWSQTMPKQVFNAATDLKLFAANGFKHLTTPEEGKACFDRLKVLETPIPSIKIVPAGTKPNIAQRRLNRAARRASNNN